MARAGGLAARAAEAMADRGPDVAEHLRHIGGHCTEAVRELTATSVDSIPAAAATPPFGRRAMTNCLPLGRVVQASLPKDRLHLGGDQRQPVEWTYLIWRRAEQCGDVGREADDGAIVAEPLGTRARARR